MAPHDCPAGGYVADYLSFWGVWLLVVGAVWLFFRATRGRTGVLRLIAGNALVLLALLWTAVVAAETYLRYVYDQTDQYGLTMTNRAWFRRHVMSNSRGFRDREFVAERRPGVARVAFVGDSFAYGWGIRDPKLAFPGLVGAALDARKPGGFEVYNFSAPGMSTTDEALIVEQLAETRTIDRVVLAYCLNDPDDLLPRDRTFDRENSPRIPWFRQTWSFLADFLWFRLRLRDDPKVQGYFEWEKEAYEDPAIWGRQCDQFKRIADACRAASMRLDVVVFPFFHRWGDAYDFGACHERVALAWKSLGVDVIDLREVYRGIPGAELVVNRFDAHPNERAHDLAARAILARAFDAP
jgi:hypothetical protein